MARTEKVQRLHRSVMAWPLFLWAVVIPSGSYAQSVLERVLSQIDGTTNLAQVNGIYANIAESVLLERTQTETQQITRDNADSSVIIFQVSGFGPSGSATYQATVGDLGTTIPAATTGFYDDLVVALDGTVTMLNSTDMVTGDPYSVLDVTSSPIRTITDVSGSAATLAGDEVVFSDGVNEFLARRAVGTSAGWDLLVETQQVSTFVSSEIDGSITNIITGVTESTEEAITGVATATEFSMPSIDTGDIATTALGAVNTGDITVGVNTAVNEASGSATRAISASLIVVGGSADTGTLMLNVAHNTSSIQGNVTNTLIGVNGSVGDVTTTALGAVNTGTITNGVDAVIQGIVGMSGQTSF